MALPYIVFQTDKRISNPSQDKVTIRQSERGLVLKGEIRAPDGTAYDLTGKTLQFAENKDGAKLVLDENVQIVDATKGTIQYELNRNVYSASGEAWIEIINANGAVVDTTQNLYITVMKDAELNVSNDNYISSLNGLESHIKDAANKAESDLQVYVNQLRDEIKQKQTDADNISSVLTKQFDTKMAEVNKQLTDYTNAYQKFSDDWAAELKKISDQANTDVQAKINGINDQYKTDFASLQNDYNKWKAQEITDFNNAVAPINQKIADNSTQLSTVSKKVDDEVAKMQTLTNQLSGVDFTQFIKPSDLNNYYKKSEVDSMVASAGKVKTVQKIQPDPAGDIEVPIIKKFDTPQDAYNASKDGNFIAIYDMNDGDQSAIIGDKTVTIQTLYDAINSLTSTVSGNSSSISDLQTQITTNKTSISDIQTAIKNLASSTALTNLQTQINDNKTSIGNNATSIASLQASVTALQNKEIWHKCSTEAEADAYRTAHPDVPLISWDS